MTAAETETGEEPELVEAWRAEQLELAGYETDAAKEIATRLDVDLHTALKLIDHGCPAELALRILL